MTAIVSLDCLMSLLPCSGQMLSECCSRPKRPDAMLRSFQAHLVSLEVSDQDRLSLVISPDQSQWSPRELRSHLEASIRRKAQQYKKRDGPLGPFNYDSVAIFQHTTSNKGSSMADSCRPTTQRNTEIIGFVKKGAIREVEKSDHQT